MSAADPQSETERLLAGLIGFNTVNPPGNERAAQEFLAEHLSSAGFECELLGAEPSENVIDGGLLGGLLAGFT